MKRQISVILILTIILSLCSFNVSADTTTSTGTIKVVKSATADAGGMLFNIASGSTTSGMESAGQVQFDESGNPNYDTFLKTVNDSYFGNVLQFDVMTSVSGKSYRMPFNLKNGDTFGNETLTNISGKYLYVSYYIKSVPDINNAKNNTTVKPRIALRDTSAKKDITVTPTGLSDTVITYSEDWTKFQGTHDVSTGTLGNYTLPTSYAAYGGAPIMRFTLGAGPYSFQMADLNVVMFDSKDTYDNVKDISTLSALSFNGNTLDVTQNNFSVNVGESTTLSQLADMISYTPYVDCNRVDVDLPESLPGYVTLTSYSLSADVTDTAETNKTVYEIYVINKTNNVKISPDFETKKAEISASIIDDKDAYIFTAYYNQKGQVIKINKYSSPTTGTSRTFSKTEDIPDGTVKAKAFLWDTSYKPISPASVKRLQIIKPEFAANGTFEDGTYTGWVNGGASNSIANEGFESNYSFKIHQGASITQDITNDIVLAGTGYYYLTSYAKSTTDDYANIAMTVYYRLTGDTEDRKTTPRVLAVNNEWTQLNEVIELADYTVNDDGTETLNTQSEKVITSAKLVISGHSNEETDYMLVDNISLSKIGEIDGTVVKEIEKPSIFVLSDSICQDYNTASYPRQGWGFTLRDYFGEDVNYFNIAVSGWSTRTFVEGVMGTYSFARPVWHKYKTAIKEGDYVIISLGHNDVGSGTKKTTPEEYKANLKTIVDDTRNAGGNVIFVSNVPNAHPTLDYSYKVGINTRYQEVFVPYAAELGVPCINMNLAMTEMENELFKDESYLASYKNGRSAHQQAIYLFNLADNGFIGSDSEFNYSITDDSLGICYDPTHIQYRGAQYVADFLAQQFVAKDLGLKDYITINDSQLISNGGFEMGLYDWTVPETRTFTFKVPEGAPQRFNNNFGKLTATGTISQDITVPLKANGGKKYTLSADVSANVSVAVKVNGSTVATATISPTSKTAEIDLSTTENVTSATIEFTADTECTFDNISLK